MARTCATMAYRMQIDRRVQRLGGRENIPELRIVKIFAVRMRIDDRALEAKEPPLRPCRRAALAGGDLRSTKSGYVSISIMR